MLIGNRSRAQGTPHADIMAGARHYADAAAGKPEHVRRGLHKWLTEEGWDERPAPPPPKSPKAKPAKTNTSTTQSKSAGAGKSAKADMVRNNGSRAPAKRGSRYQKTRPDKAPSEYKPGKWVKHPDRGEGRITSVTGAKVRVNYMDGSAHECGYFVLKLID